MTAWPLLPGDRAEVLVNGIVRATLIVTADAIEIIPQAGGFVSSAEGFADGKLLRLTYVEPRQR